jgi:hypothetical protein
VPALEELLKFKKSRLMVVKAFETMDELLYQVQTNNTREFCFGLVMTDIAPNIDEVNITMMFPMDAAQNTYDPIYDQTTGSPNFWNWNTTFLYGTPQF